MKLEDMMKNAFQDWDEDPNEVHFDKDRVWRNIRPRQQKTFRLFYPVAAAAVLLCLLGSSLYLFHSNQKLQEEYQASLLRLEQKQEDLTKIVVQKEVETKIETKYKTKVQEVIRESPELQKKVKVLETQLAKLAHEREKLNQQFQNAISQVKSLKDSVSVLKAKEPIPLFTENRTAKKAERNDEIRVNIDEKALADLPVNKGREADRRLKLKIREEKKEDARKSVPKLARIPLNYQ